MARMQVKIVHDCVKPLMLEDEKVFPQKTFWNVLFNTDPKPIIRTKVKVERARWQCPRRAEWEWFGNTNDGFWMIRYRPDKWEWRDV